MQSGKSSPNSSSDMNKVNCTIVGKTDRVVTDKVGQLQTTVVGHIPHSKLSSPILSSRTGIG